MYAIEFNHVWKSFRKGESATALRDAIPKLFNRLTGKKAERGMDPTFWALKDVSFKLSKGQTLGIIGPNGAGKSTALKILAGVMRPNKGDIKVNGRLSALIEISAGFHADLTGRENVFLQGAIMGMGKREIKEKFDSIVEFSGVEDFLDTPLKRYSSGMYVRLGFAVAAHTDPEILLIDEVLAVGDNAFQVKCLSKIQELQNQGSTILFVSHDMAKVRRVCNKAILLMKGKRIIEDEPSKCILEYERKARESWRITGRDVLHGIKGTKEVELVDIILTDDDGNVTSTFGLGENINVKMIYRANQPVKNPVFAFGIASVDGTLLCYSCTKLENIFLGEVYGEGEINIRIKDIRLCEGVYIIGVSILSFDLSQFLDIRTDCFLTIRSERPHYPLWNPIYDQNLEWKIDK